MIRLVTSCAQIDWHRAVEIFRLAPLGGREAGKLQRTFAGSFATVFAFDQEQLIGMGRAISDGEDQAAIYDVVVLPDYQRQGVGKMIMADLVSRLPVKNIILYAVPGKEDFYKKCGFRVMKTAMARLDAGMSNPKAGYLEVESP